MHGLEIGSAGQVAFATRKEPAWHNLGTVFDDDMTTEEMLREAFLNGWNVRLDEIVPMNYPNAIAVSPHFAVVRDNPFEEGRTDVLGIVGSRYHPKQNEELLAFGDAMLDGGGRWETAGSIQGGRQVFASLRLGEDITVGGHDKVGQYLLLNTAHDGSVSVQASVTPVRVVCQNTLNLAISGVRQTYKVRHTAGAEQRIAAAREALGLAFKYSDAFAEEAERLIATECTKDEFLKIVDAIYPQPSGDGVQKNAVTRWENKRDLLLNIYTGSVAEYGAPNTQESITGTAWGALNALTERLDWYRTPRGGDPTAIYEAASGFSPVANAAKQTIHKAVLAFADSK